MLAIDGLASAGFCSTRLANITDWMNRYIDGGKLAGAHTLIARHGEVVYSNCAGMADMERRLKWQSDTILRIYSMTKPVTTVALMMLLEKGLLCLDDPVEEYIPAFKDMQVLRPGAQDISQTAPAEVKLTIHHLLLHTSGLTYGFNAGPLSAAYNDAKVDFAVLKRSLAEEIDNLATLPLQFTPGTRWNYGVSTDVVGRLVEIISGMRLDQFFQENIFAPLGMGDTSFYLPEEKADRMASLYGPGENGSLSLMESGENSLFLNQRMKGFSGGGGLLSTAGDYLKFCEMLRCGGSYGETRLLGPRIVDFMKNNHLPGDLKSIGEPVFAEIPFAGVGFGLGGWVMLSPPKAEIIGSAGDFGWGGRASTVFWIDPVEELSVIFMTQFKPSNHYRLRRELRALTYQALID